MSWIGWLASVVALCFVGTYFIRTGKIKIVKLYAVSCLVLLLMSLTNFALLFGTSFSAWPGMVLSVLAPATLILAIIVLQRDRAAVMGRQTDRDALATAAIVYGASGGYGAGGGAEGGDVGGGMEI